MRLSMTHFVTLACLVGLLAHGTARPQNLLKDRARWEWTLPDSKGDVTNGTFTCWQDGKITVGPLTNLKKIGTWSSVAADEVHLHIKTEPLTGIIRVKKTKAVSPTYEGEIAHQNGGKKEKIEIKLFKD